MPSLNTWRRLAALAGCGILLTACSTTRAPSGYGMGAHSERQSIATTSTKKRAPVEDRSGLGTGWGEHRDSWVSGSDFVRSTAGPAETTRIMYNDREGISGMLTWPYAERRSSFSVGGLASVRIRGSGRVRSLKGYSMGNKNYVVGEHGQRYSIVIRNNSHQRIEVVVSVDGLDVLDGRSASTSKRGYVISPRDSVTIEGWRKDWSGVAAFKFGSVSSSYAARSGGSTRNVGVIGIAAFREKPRAWSWTSSPDKTDRRQTADPFPGDSGFARPPRR